MLRREQQNAALEVKLDGWQREIRAFDLLDGDRHFIVPIRAGEHGGAESAVV
jgi:hypothetical protein